MSIRACVPELLKASPLLHERLMMLLKSFELHVHSCILSLPRLAQRTLRLLSSELSGVLLLDIAMTVTICNFSSLLTRVKELWVIQTLLLSIVGRHDFRIFVNLG